MQMAKEMDLADLIRDWDGEYVVMRHDHQADAWIFIAAHSSRLGHPAGGTRMKVYDTPMDGLRDALRLAEGMTYKWAGVDFPIGGGKAVISLTRPLDGVERDGLLERHGELIESLAGSFSTGADLGVGAELVSVIARKTKYALGEGAGDPGPYTALGVFKGIEAAAEFLYGSPELNGRTVLVQGIGDVGVPLSKHLSEAGADLKLVDVNEGRVKVVAAELGAKVVAAEGVYDEPCDIFAPCAVGGVLNSETIVKLHCAAVAGSANNQLETAEDAERLHKSGILYAPDYIINAGGATALPGLELLGMSEGEVRERVIAIGSMLAEIFEEAKKNDESPVHAAERRARRVLERGPV